MHLNPNNATQKIENSFYPADKLLASIRPSFRALNDVVSSFYIANMRVNLNTKKTIFRNSKRWIEAKNVRMHIGSGRRHEIYWHRKVATKPGRSSNTVSVSLRAIRHCDESERYGSGDDCMERCRCYVVPGKCSRTLDWSKRMDEIRCENTSRESTIHVVNGFFFFFFNKTKRILKVGFRVGRSVSGSRNNSEFFIRVRSLANVETDTSSNHFRRKMFSLECRRLSIKMRNWMIYSIEFFLLFI